MKNLKNLFLFSFLFASLLLVGCNNQQVELEDGDNSEVVDVNLSNDDADLSQGGDLLPSDYPHKKLPLMKGAKVLSVEPYAGKGFVVHYQISESVEKIDKFYSKILKAAPVEKDEEEVYYEDVDLGDNVKVIGLGIEDMDGKTSNVFITVFIK